MSINYTTNSNFPNSEPSTHIKTSPLPKRCTITNRELFLLAFPLARAMRSVLAPGANESSRPQVSVFDLVHGDMALKLNVPLISSQARYFSSAIANKVGEFTPQ